MHLKIPTSNLFRTMAKPTFSKLAERVFAVRAAWRRTIPVRVRVEAVRRAASLRDDSVPVIKGEGPNPLWSVARPFAGSSSTLASPDSALFPTLTPPTK